MGKNFILGLRKCMIKVNDTCQENINTMNYNFKE